MKKLEKFDKDFKEIVNNYMIAALTAIITFMISGIIVNEGILIAVATILMIVSMTILIIACNLKEFAMKKLTELLEEERQ